MRNNSNFRPGIEGLRAIAIFLVVAAHVNVSFMEGGFIGVDVFFVISGFLITGLLLREFEEKGKIDLIAFYARRLKRLLPALFFMVVVICAVTAVLLAPFEHDNQAISALSSIAWVSNMYFALANFGYFDSSAESNLFLHTWSLGVEEQFYIVWPALIIALAKIYNLNGSKADAPDLIKSLILLFSVTLIASLVLFAVKPLWGFYFMPSRAWQFAAGAIAYYYVSSSERQQSPGISSRYIYLFGSLAGMACLVAAALAFDNSSPYPGFRALLPTAGAVLLLICVAGKNKQHALTRYLSTPAMQWFGKLSYSWYLWHWPVVVLSSTLTGNHEPAFLIPLACVALGCAAFSYYLIESPIRYNQWLSYRKLTTIITSLFAMAVFLGIGTVWIERSQAWSRQPEQKLFKEIQLDVSRIYIDQCDQWYQSADVRPCAYGNPDASNTAVLMGDSVGVQWFPALYELFGGGDWKLILLTKGSCPIIDESFYYDRLKRNFIECDLWRDAAIDWIIEQSPKILFMGNSQIQFTQRQWIEGTKRILDKVTNKIPKVIIIRPTYPLPFHGPACIARSNWQSKFISPLIDCSTPAGNAGSENIMDWLEAAAEDYSGAAVLDLNELVCPNDVCSAIVNGKPVFRDNQHITASFARSLYKHFEEVAR